MNYLAVSAFRNFFTNESLKCNSALLRKFFMHDFVQTAELASMIFSTYSFKDILYDTFSCQSDPAFSVI